MILKIISTCFLFLFLTSTFFAQTNSRITGTIHDQAGAAIAGATVTAKNLETNIDRTAVSDAEGRYTFPELRVGRYEVRSEKSGFKPAVVKDINLTIGETAVINLSLELVIRETVEVTEPSTQVNTTSAELSYLVGERTIRELPLNGRNYTDLALLQPGVTAYQQRDGGSVVAHGLGMTINGQDIRSNVYLLDGTLLNDFTNSPAGSAANSVLGTETIREFRVEANSYSAEFGRNYGGQINAISKSGTNQFHGSAYEFLRNDNLDARNFFDREPVGQPEFKRNQFGGTVGGPIVRDRTFFFAGAEFLRDRLGRSILTTVPDQKARQGILTTRNPDGSSSDTTVGVNPAVQPYLAAFPLPNGALLNGGVGNLGQYLFSFGQRLDQEYLQGRIDHKLTKDQQVFVRYTFDNAKQF